MSATANVTKLQPALREVAHTEAFSYNESRRFNWDKFTSVLFDTMVIAANGVGVLLLFGDRLNTGSWGATAKITLPTNNLRHYLGALLIYASLTVLACAGAELYSSAKALIQSHLRMAAKPLALATAVFYAFMWCMNVDRLYWLMVATLATFDLIGVVGWRRLQRHFALSRAASGHGGRRALIIGAGQGGQELARYLRGNALLGYSVVGFVDDRLDHGPDVLGSLNDFSKVVHAEFIDDVFVAGTLDGHLLGRLRDEAVDCRVNVQLVPGISQCAGHWRHIGDLPVQVLRYEPIPRVGLYLKRLLDIFGATTGLIMFLPLFMIVGVAITLDSPGPWFYCSCRVGKKGVKFKCVKFRTMRVDAEAMKEQLRARNQREGPTFKIEDDPRITRLGRYLRKYSIDELPQLWNVLKGDMSLVGPRPHPLDDYDRYELDHRVRLTVTPGLTGIWQITSRSDPSFERNMALDLEYIRNWSFWRDLKILVGTLPAVIRGEGV